MVLTGASRSLEGSLEGRVQGRVQGSLGESLEGSLEGTATATGIVIAIRMIRARAERVADALQTLPAHRALAAKRSARHPQRPPSRSQEQVRGGD